MDISSPNPQSLSQHSGLPSKLPLLSGTLFQRYPNLLKVIYFSLVQMIFLGVANSLMAILGLITHQNNRDWAGPIATMLLFIFSGLGSIFTFYFGRYRFNMVFFLSSLGYTFYVGSSIVFVLLKDTEGIGLVVGVFALTVVSGVIISAFYMSQFYYTSVCARLDKTSMHFGVNMGIVQCANIIGNVLSTYTIEPLGELNYTIMMTCLIVGIAFLFLFVKQAGTKQDLLKIQSQAEQIHNTQPTTTPKKSMYSLFPAYFFTGVTITFIYVYFSILMYRTFSQMQAYERYSLTFKLLILQGVGEFLGGMYVVKYADRWPKPTQILAMNNAFVLSLIGCYIGHCFENVYVIAVSIVAMGFINCGGFALDLAVIGEEGWGKKGYTAFNLGQCGGVALSVTLLLIFDYNIELFMCYMIVCQVVSSTSLHSFK